METENAIPQTAQLCRNPDGYGTYHPRCQHIIERPRGETEPRRCLAAAQRGTLFCTVHSEGEF